MSALTELHRCKITGEALLKYGFYGYDSHPNGWPVGTPVEQRFCGVCNMDHEGTVTVYEFDPKKTLEEVADELGAPWMGTPKGAAVRQRSREQSRQARAPSSS